MYICFWVFSSSWKEMKKKKGCEKKNGADTEMGYCPFEHKAGRAALGVHAGALGTQARALGAGRRRVRGTAWTARGAQGRARHVGRRGSRRCDTIAWCCDTAG